MEAKKVISSILYILCGFLVVDNDGIIRLIPDVAGSAVDNIYDSHLLKHVESDDIAEINTFRVSLHTNKYHLWQKLEIIVRRVQSVGYIKSVGEKSRDIYFLLYMPFSSGFKPKNPDDFAEEPGMDDRARYYLTSLYYMLEKYERAQKNFAFSLSFQKILIEPSDYVNYRDNVYMILSRELSIKQNRIKLYGKR